MIPMAQKNARHMVCTVRKNPQKENRRTLCQLSALKKSETAKIDTISTSLYFRGMHNRQKPAPFRIRTWRGQK